MLFRSLPGAVSIMALSWIYVLYGRLGIVSALFFGLKSAVLAVVLEAVMRIGSRALRSNAARLLASAAFVLIFFFGVPFPAIVLGAGLLGWGAGRARADACGTGVGCCGCFRRPTGPRAACNGRGVRPRTTCC